MVLLLTRAEDASAAPARILYLQRRASYQTRKGRCSTLTCCMFLVLNRVRFKETCSREHAVAGPGKEMGKRHQAGRDRPVAGGA
ncbi:hypothetical protein FKV68_12805 [Sinorhizobium mexicanum]|uniref:Uncharacterized protein n=1 Tax=Sinorhizobium mexicanum TaxID=375549 RepID=A0A859QY29_9HYPH|nr:hypothetical protein FKV68_12805 [Sinorhizobium mexicanum]